MLELQKERAERDARVQAHVEQFYVASDAVEAAEAKLEAARVAHEQAQADARDQQAQVVQALAGEKLGENEIASLCGITVAQVRSLRRTSTSSSAGDTAADAGQDALADDTDADAHGTGRDVAATSASAAV